MKTCSTCKTQKPYTDFRADVRYSDGYMGQCNTCRNAKKSEYHLNNKEKIKATKAVWRANNKEKLVSYRIKYHAKYPDKITATRRNWESKNREAIRNIKATRRSRLEANAVYVISRKELHKLHNSACIYCGSFDRISMDHVVPIYRGGSHGIGNLVSACLACNSSKKDRTIMEWRLSNAPLRPKKV